MKPVHIVIETGLDVRNKDKNVHDATFWNKVARAALSDGKYHVVAGKITEIEEPQEDNDGLIHANTLTGAGI